MEAIAGSTRLVGGGSVGDFAVVLLIRAIRASSAGHKNVASVAIYPFPDENDR
jgi:hypothetical protein